MRQQRLGFSICQALYSVHHNLFTYLSPKSRQKAGKAFYSPSFPQHSSPTVPGTLFALSKCLLCEHFPTSRGTRIIRLTGEPPGSPPAWQGDLKPPHGDWLQLQGCVRARGAGEMRRRAGPASAGAKRPQLGCSLESGLRVSELPRPERSGRNCLVSLQEWG